MTLRSNVIIRKGGVEVGIADDLDLIEGSGITIDAVTIAPRGVQLTFGFDDSVLATDANLAAHTGDTDDAHDASAISIADAGNDFTATTVEGALDELQADNEAHVAAADPHGVYQLESAHTKAQHDALGLSHDSLADVSINDHHAETHADAQHSDGPNAKASDPLGLGYPVSVDPATASTTQASGTANNAYYLKSLGYATLTKNGLTVGTASGNIDVGIYAGSGAGRSATPAARRASSGSTACPSSGYAEVAVSAAMAVGDWFAIAADNTTATFRSVSALSTTDNLLNGRAGRQLTAFPLPDPASMSAALMRQFVLVGVA